MKISPQVAMTLRQIMLMNFVSSAFNIASGCSKLRLIRFSTFLSLIPVYCLTSIWQVLLPV